jgi:hypothetical protein
MSNKRKALKDLSCTSEKGMTIITINVPMPFLELFERIINEGYFTSRSELIRHLIIIGVQELINEVLIPVDDLIKPEDPNKILIDGKEYKLRPELNGGNRK